MAPIGRSFTARVEVFAPPLPKDPGRGTNCCIGGQREEPDRGARARRGHAHRRCGARRLGATTQPAWPRTFTSGATKVVVYQPQVTQWPNYTVLSALAALAVTQPGAKSPTYGTATFSGYTAADFRPAS